MGKNLQEIQELKCLDLEEITHDPVYQQTRNQNKIRTAIYTKLSFFPLNLLFQVLKPSNVYFLAISAFQMIPQISNTGGLPTTLGPLVFVIFISMLKDLLEDLKRQKLDQQENRKEVLRVSNDSETSIEQKDVKEGDLLKILKDQQIPADLLIVFSTLEEICFVETKNLDGETNLKRVEIPYEIKKAFNKNNPEAFLLGSRLQYEHPNSILSSFSGVLLHENQEIILSQKNLLLRGCTLKNTDFIIGLVVYSGHDSKIMQNLIPNKKKSSSLESQLQMYILFIVAVQIFICALGSVLNSIWLHFNHSSHPYIEVGYSNWFSLLVIQFFIWFLLCSNLIPISLIVMIEVVKFIQASMATKDDFMKSSSGIYMVVNSSNLNEELGQIDYIFSDKTGTLTQNKMIFKKLVVGDQIFPDESFSDSFQKKFEFVDFND